MTIDFFVTNDYTLITKDFFQIQDDNDILADLFKSDNNKTL